MNNTLKCAICGNERKPGKTTYTVDLGFGVLVVRDVPAMICVQCGEEWIDAQTAKNLEIIIKEAHKRKTQFEVLTYKNGFGKIKVAMSNQSQKKTNLTELINVSKKELPRINLENVLVG